MFSIESQVRINVYNILFTWNLSHELQAFAGKAFVENIDSIKYIWKKSFKKRFAWYKSVKS